MRALDADHVVDYTQEDFAVKPKRQDLLTIIELTESSAADRVTSGPEARMTGIIFRSFQHIAPWPSTKRC